MTRRNYAATVEKGRQLFEVAVEKTEEYLQGMIAGGNREIQPHLMWWQRDAQANRR